MEMARRGKPWQLPTRRSTPPRRLETRTERGFPHFHSDHGGWTPIRQEDEPRQNLGLRQIPAQNRKDKPAEWEQGASGYGKRFANIAGQYSIQRTVTFTLASALNEDNRYFNSGKQGIWPRAGYALASGILARHEDGSRHVSISQLGGVAAGAFLSRTWQPPSQHSMGNGAVSFGITMASNMGFSVVKEFLPDRGRLISKSTRSTLTRISPPTARPCAVEVR